MLQACDWESVAGMLNDMRWVCVSYLAMNAVGVGGRAVQTKAVQTRLVAPRRAMRLYANHAKTDTHKELNYSDHVVAWAINTADVVGGVIRQPI
jgi:hypothetical protein